MDPASQFPRSEDEFSDTTEEIALSAGFSSGL
jgi:hypothetical protein